MDIKIWTDGSYKKKKCGCAFYINFGLDEGIDEIVCFNSSAKSSTEAELLTVITAIKYIIYLGINLHDKVMLKIYTDLDAIAEAYNEKRYRIWERNGWRTKSGKPIKSHIDLWYQWTCLVNSIPDSNLVIHKVKSKNDDRNRLAHKYSNIARAMPLLSKNSIIVYKTKNGEIYEQEAIENIINKAIREIIKYKTPWERYKQENKHIYNQGEIININPCNIYINDDKHINCIQIYFGKSIKRVYKRGYITSPILVYKDKDKYILIKGMKGLIISKILNLHEVPCVICNNLNEINR